MKKINIRHKNKGAFFIKLAAFVFLLFMFIFQNVKSQVFIPFSFLAPRQAKMTAIPNTDAPQSVLVSQSVAAVNSTQMLSCNSTYYSATSSDTSVLSLANITFSGTFPNCFINMLTTVSSGTSNVSVTFTNTLNSTTQSFTFTAYQKPVMAFSFRKVVRDFIGSPIRVRRISDNAESDIGFDSSGNLDLTAYNAFKGASTLQLKIWYDQSGNGYNATQTTTTLQPGITTSGFNGAPQVDFSATYWLATTQAQNILSVNRDVTIFYASKAVSESKTVFGVRGAGSDRVGAHMNWSDGNLYWDSPGTCCTNPRISVANGANANLAKTYTVGRSNTYQYIKINGVDAVTKNTASGTLTATTLIWFLGAFNNNGSATAGEIVTSPLAEYVQYTAGLTDAQVSVIANEQKNYFGL